MLLFETSERVAERLVAEAEQSTESRSGHRALSATKRFEDLQVNRILDRIGCRLGCECEMGGVQASSRISPNVDVGPDCYANDILADASVVLTDSLTSGTGRFDASDLMPAEVGSGSFWTGMIEYMRNGPDNVETVLDNIEDSWPS